MSTKSSVDLQKKLAARKNLKIEIFDRGQSLAGFSPPPPSTNDMLFSNHNLKEPKEKQQNAQKQILTSTTTKISSKSSDIKNVVQKELIMTQEQAGTKELVCANHNSVNTKSKPIDFLKRLVFEYIARHNLTIGRFATLVDTDDNMFALWLFDNSFDEELNKNPHFGFSKIRKLVSRFLKTKCPRDYRASQEQHPCSISSSSTTSSTSSISSQLSHT